MRQRLIETFRRDAFTPGTGVGCRIGAEIELIPVDAQSGRRCPIVARPESGGAPATLPVLRRVAAREGWVERPSPYGAPVFVLPTGGAVSYEPGGQIEYSAPPSASLATLVARLRATVSVLSADAGDTGIEMLSVGFDPYNRIDDVPLQLHGHRYAEMDAYLATRGSAGGRMMRQTAAFQVTVDAGEDPVGAWRVLSAAAPYVTAMFANSSRSVGGPAGSQSVRAQVWRALDAARTGLPAATARDPAADYVAFALAAPAILRRAPDGGWRPFGELMDRGVVTERDDWGPHLTTLFPEVRPRHMGDGPTFEVRSADALPPQWFAAPLVLVAGITHDRRARREAADLLGPADPGLLGRAARQGLRDRAIGAVAGELFAVARRGAARLGERVVGGAELEVAHEFAGRYTERRLSPADAAETASTGADGRIADRAHASTLG